MLPKSFVIVGCAATLIQLLLYVIVSGEWLVAAVCTAIFVFNLGLKV